MKATLNKRSIWFARLLFVLLLYSILVYRDSHRWDIYARQNLFNQKICQQSSSSWWFDHHYRRAVCLVRTMLLKNIRFIQLINRTGRFLFFFHLSLFMTAHYFSSSIELVLIVHSLQKRKKNFMARFVYLI